MKTTIRRYTAAIGLSLLCAVAVAAPKDSSIDKLIDASGITKQVAEFPAMVKSGFSETIQQGSSLTDEQIATILSSADKEIQPAVIIKDIRESLKVNLSEKEVETLLAWYETDLGKRIAKAEEDASTPAAYQDMLDNAQQLMGNTKRMEVAQRLDKLLGATDWVVDFQEYSSIAIYSAVMTAVFPSQPLDFAGIRAQVEAMEPQVRAQAKPMVDLSFVYTYRDINDKDLGKYEAFLGEPASQKFNKAGLEGMNRGFEKVIYAWAGSVGEVIKNQPAQ